MNFNQAITRLLNRRILHLILRPLARFPSADNGHHYGQQPTDDGTRLHVTAYASNELARRAHPAGRAGYQAVCCQY